jgi:hypothetical protein
MSVNIDVNGIKNSIVAACNTAYAKASEWMGRAIVVIKSGIDTALPYLQQDKRIAAVALIVTTLALSEIVNLFSLLWNKHFPNDSALKRGFRDFVDVTAGIAIIGGGVAAFAKYTKIPFSPLAILGISAGTVIVRAAMTSTD